MNDLINEARELASEASDAPWECFDTSDYTEIHVPNGKENGYPPVAITDATYNAAFIARSRTLVPELADALEKAEGELKLYHDAADACEYMTSTDCDYCINMINLAARAEKAEAELATYKSAAQNWHGDGSETNPPRPHGEWERMINPYGELEGFMCQCGHQSQSAANFCGMCGADMRKEADRDRH